jgi:hypothetical protein
VAGKAALTNTDLAGNGMVETGHGALQHMKSAKISRNVNWFSTFIKFPCDEFTWRKGVCDRRAALSLWTRVRAFQADGA